jgi:hypothetical protein
MGKLQGREKLGEKRRIWEENNTLNFTKISCKFGMQDLEMGGGISFMTLKTKIGY